MTIETELEAELYKRSFYKFFVESFKKVLDPSVTYIDNWHIKYICDIMQMDAERIIEKTEKDDDIIINVPVRSGKSLVVSVAYNAWVWIRDPTFKLITASYSSRLSMQLATKTRDLVKSPWYQERFGHIYGLKKDQDTKSYFETDKGGYRFATSTGATATGMGGDQILIDDLMNPDEAESEQKRYSSLEWYDVTLWSRLNTPAIGSRFIIMQRLHDKDLTGHLLEKGGYEHICIPAESCDNVKPSYLREHYIEGLFFKERFNQKILSGFKKALGERAYQSQFGQSPIILSGNIINTSKIGYLEEEPKALRVIQTVDTAFKTGEKNDYSVCMTWCVFRHKGSPDIDSYFLMHVLRAKYEFPELKKRIEQIAKKYKPYKLIVEDKASGQSLIQELQRDSYLKPLILPVKPDRDKVTRAYSITSVVNDGRVYMPKNATWLYDLIEELGLFDSGEHDDQVDAFVYALQYFTKKIGDHRVPSIRIL